MTIRSVAALTFLLLVFGACHDNKINIQRQGPPPSPTQLPTATPQDTVDRFLSEILDPVSDRERKGYLLSWHKVRGHERYEVAQYVHGEVAGAYGLAMIITDGSSGATNRSSLIVFIERPAHRFDLYWIFKEEDLSRVSISRSSGDIWANGLRGDGSKITCEIAWSRQPNKWTCIPF